MKLLFDFLPIVLFFAVYKIYDDFYLATAVIIVATAVQVAFSWWHSGKIERMPLIALGLLVLFGGITLLLQDEIYLKWKVSIVNWLFGAVFLGSQFIGHKPIIQRMMDSQIGLPDLVWQRLNMAWAVFFIAMGLINLFVMFQFDTDIWVSFKLYGLLGLTLLFVLAQGFYLSRHIDMEEDNPKPQED